MPLVLCIETATTNCSVALAKDGKLLDLQEDYDTQYSHAERLHLFVEDILKRNAVSAEELDAIAVSKGPGSYTGLRIGVSAAKGLCFSLDVPLIAVPTLEALAHQVLPEEGHFIIPVLDARRMEVYTAGFTANYEPVFETRAEILEPSAFEDYLNQNKVWFIGNAVEKLKTICTHPKANFIEGKLPSASEMVMLAHQKFLNEDFEDVAYFEPYYLKDFISS